MAIKTLALFSARPHLTLAVCICMFAAGQVMAQTSPDNSSDETTLQVTLKQNKLAYDKASVHVHALRVQKPGTPGALPSQSLLPAAAPDANPSGPVAFYPGDLSYQGGPTMTTAKSHNLYVDCLASCFGYPGHFQGHLYNSDLIHVVDQYVGSTASNRYNYGFEAVIAGNIFATLGDNDILNIVYAGATAHTPVLTGYTNIYNVFLPQGVDLCPASVGGCYSPDNPSTFTFCAYHESVTFSDIGHVIFTVIPYQAVPGCEVTSTTPNGEVADSTASSVSHETIEAITDPDGSAWWNTTTNIIYGAEIGDECSLAYGNPPTTTLDGKPYAIQSEYSNAVHGCTYNPLVSPN